MAADWICGLIVDRDFRTNVLLDCDVLSLQFERMPQLISEPITPLELGNAAMTAGEPALPLRFKWRDAEYTVFEVVSKEREFRREGHTASGELYLRKHWVEVVTTTGERMKLYCERQARGRNKAQRWWLYSMGNGE